MIKITTAQLVGFANKRLLPPIFEKGWQGTYITNPVVLTIERWLEARNMMWAAVTSTVVATLIADTQITSGLVPSAIMVGAITLVLAGFSFRNAANLSSTFRAELAEGIKFLGYDKLETVFEFGDESLRQVANIVLTAAASDILKLEKQHTQPRTPEELKKKTQLLKDLGRKYDVFLHLGLVPQGGYERYFEQAEKELAKARSPVQVGGGLAI